MNKTCFVYLLVFCPFACVSSRCSALSSQGPCKLQRQASLVSVGDWDTLCIFSNHLSA